MPEYSPQQVDYAKYRLERSQEDLQCAEKLFDDGHFRAALALKSVDSSKHSGVISEFRKIYIKSGSIPAEVSQMIGAAFTIRNASDYDDMFIASKDETKEQIENAKYVYEQISVYIGKQLD